MSDGGVSDFERIETVFGTDELYAIADALPLPPREHGGRPRQYPMYAYLAFGELVHVFRSARNAAIQLRHPAVWQFVQETVRKRFPDQPEMWLPDKPMARHHWLDFRASRVIASGAFTALQRLHEQIAARQARLLGLCSPTTPGSLSHPSAAGCQFGDGKVMKTNRGGAGKRQRLDKKTGELRTIARDPDAKLHRTGGGETAFGVKYAFVAARGERPHERIILAFDHVPSDEARVAVELFDRTLAHLPDTQAVLYDGAFRGVHKEQLARRHGVTLITPAAPAVAGKKEGEQRVERRKHISTVTVDTPAGTKTIALYTEATRLHMGAVSADGELVLVPLELINIARGGKPGAYRRYGLYRLPETEGGGTIRVPLHETAEDRVTGLNRAEHLAAIAPGDPDYERLYGLRSDAESINRGYNDRHYLGRAHSIGKDRQLVDVLTHAMLVNALAVHRYAKTGDPPALTA